MKQYMKLSQYAKLKSVTYGTALRHWHLGKINGYQDKDTGSIYVEIEQEKNLSDDKRVSLYARVSSNENKDNGQRQLERLRLYALAKGYKVVGETLEIASGLNDRRPKLEKVLSSNDYNILLVEHKDRLTRFGYNYIKVLLSKNGQELEVINEVQEEREDLVTDLVSIITSFCARLYGQRRAKRKTEQLIKELEIEKDETTNKDTGEGQKNRKKLFSENV